MCNEKTQGTSKPNLNFMSADSIFESIYKPPCAVIENFLQGGVYILAGPPKIGKSILAENIAFHVSSGASFWNFDVKKSAVLYLALEDSFARIQRRLSQLCGVETNFNNNLYFATQADTLKTGLLEMLSNFKLEHPEVKLIIVDPLQKIIGDEANICSYSEGYDMMASLKDLSDKQDLCILLVHHTRKKEAADSFAKISGSTGLFGAVDGAFVMSKKSRSSNAATLEFTGRDMPEQTYFIELDRQSLVWNLKNVDHEPWKNPPDPILEKINSFLDGDRNEWHGTATDLISEADLDSRFVKPNSLTRKLNVKVGELRDEYDIEYVTTRGHERQIFLKRISR